MKIDDEHFLDSIIRRLKNGVDHPAQFGAEIEEFVRTHEISGITKIERAALDELEIRISSAISVEERKTIAGIGLEYVGRLVKGMDARPFVQSMCGSSAKASKHSALRSLNIYTFEFGREDYVVKRTRYNLDGDDTKEPEMIDDEFRFSNRGHVTIRGIESRRPSTQAANTTIK